MASDVILFLMKLAINGINLQNGRPNQNIYIRELAFKIATSLIVH